MYRFRKQSAVPGERETPSIWNSSEAWAACAKALREYDEARIQDWKEEIDTLLVFAGLFSAVVTTFNIEAYKLLQQQPEDSVVAILTQISSQMNSFTVNSNFINTTHPANAGRVQPFRPNAFAVRLNALWFSSLVCGLLSASLGLLVKQWLREYLAGSSNISREGIRIRQYRYEGLRRWHTAEIILCLPILLQVALLLFFIGLVDFLWTLHPVVAAVITAIIAVSMLFAIMTSLLPPLYPSCPYKSPQSWLICMFIQSLKRSVRAIASHYYAQLYHRGHSQAHTHPHGAATPDPFASKLDLPTMMHNRLAEKLRACLHRISLVRPYSSWKEREKSATEASRVATALDDATLAGADAMFMDDTFLQTVVRPCMRDIAPRAALRCLDQILLRRAPRELNDMPYWELARPIDAARGDCGTLTLMHLLLDVLERLNDSRAKDFDIETVPDVDEEDGAVKDDARRRVLLTMHRLVRAIPTPSKPDAAPHPEDREGDSETRAVFRRIFEVLAGVLGTEVERATPERFVRERSFNLMLKLFPRFQAVGATCITAFCAYGRQIRTENAPYRFVQACYMVVRAAAVLARDAHVSVSASLPSADGPPTLPPLPYSLEKQNEYISISRTSSVTLCAEPLQDAAAISACIEMDDAPSDAMSEYASVRPAVLGVLHDLEGFLSAPVSRASEYRPTTAMVAECAQAVLLLASCDRGAVSRGLVCALSEMVGLEAATGDGWDGYVGEGGCRGDGDGAFDVEREHHDAVMAGQAVRLLRKLYGMRALRG